MEHGGSMLKRYPIVRNESILNSTCEFLKRFQSSFSQNLSRNVFFIFFWGFDQKLGKNLTARNFTTSSAILCILSKQVDLNKCFPKWGQSCS